MKSIFLVMLLALSCSSFVEEQDIKDIVIDDTNFVSPGLLQFSLLFDDTLTIVVKSVLDSNQVMVSLNGEYDTIKKIYKNADTALVCIKSFYTTEIDIIDSVDSEIKGILFTGLRYGIYTLENEQWILRKLSLFEIKKDTMTAHLRYISLDNDTIFSPGELYSIDSLSEFSNRLLGAKLDLNDGVYAFVVSNNKSKLMFKDTTDNYWWKLNKTRDVSYIGVVDLRFLKNNFFEMNLWGDGQN